MEFNRITINCNKWLLAVICQGRNKICTVKEYQIREKEYQIHEKEVALEIPLPTIRSNEKDDDDLDNDGDEIPIWR
ncbi:hypothetical protein L1887_37209 [Cichorium endivia]|nr:hypothetical protein L1887_37209 [Cichorium endivia]